VGVVGHHPNGSQVGFPQAFMRGAHLRAIGDARISRQPDVLLEVRGEGRERSRRLRGPGRAECRRIRTDEPKSLPLRSLSPFSCRGLPHDKNYGVVSLRSHLARNVQALHHRRGHHRQGLRRSPLLRRSVAVLPEEKVSRQICSRIVSQPPRAPPRRRLIPRTAVSTRSQSAPRALTL